MAPTKRPHVLAHISKVLYVEVVLDVFRAANVKQLRTSLLHIDGINTKGHIAGAYIQSSSMHNGTNSLHRALEL